MNKQEVIEKIKRGTEYFSNVNDYRRGFRDGLNYSLLVLRSLDEPEKPVVPKFVADWYEAYKCCFEWSLYNLCIDFHERKLQEDLLDWFRDNTNEPIETLVMMHKFGYVIEEGLEDE